MQLRNRRGIVVCLFALATLALLTNAFAKDADAVHIVSGIVKHVDRGTKKVIVKTSDGVEHTIKWTGKTSWEGTEDAGKGVKEGSTLTVRYTEKAGEKTAVGIKDIGKGDKKAVE